MASFKSSFFLSLLVLISAFMAAPSSVEAFLNLNSFVRANGVVPCSLIATLPGNVPPFPNARVEMRCGGTTMANTTTNSAGNFTLGFRPTQSLVMKFLTLPDECKVVVPTTLDNCDPSLPAVGLEASVNGFQTYPGINGLAILVPVFSGFFVCFYFAKLCIEGEITSE